MKIVYVSTSVLPSHHANSVHVMKMCSALRTYCDEVILVGIDGEQPNANLYEFYNTKNEFKVVLTSKRKKDIIHRVFDVLKNVKNADFVYTRWHIGAFVSSFFAGKKVIMEYHSYPYDFIGRLLLKINKYNKKIIEVVFITESLKEYFLERKAISINQKTIVLPDGSDVMHEYNRHKNFEICYVGSFLPGKGVDTVVKLANVMPNFRFHIIGGNNVQIEEYKKLSEHNNIIWHGFLCQKDIERVVYGCSVALLPNKSKVLIDGKKDIGEWTSPLKMFEYMAQSKAIIASDLKILKEILVDGYNAVLVEPENIEKWKQAVLLLENDRDLLEVISTNAFNDIRLKYSWDRRAEQVIRSIKSESEV